MLKLLRTLFPDFLLRLSRGTTVGWTSVPELPVGLATTGLINF